MPPSLPTLPECERLISSHSRKAQLTFTSSRKPSPHRGRAAPPVACTAPWRPPVQPGSLGSLPPAASPDSAGPAAPRHPPTGQGGRLQRPELARQACLSLVPPGPLSALPGDPLALLVTLLQALTAVGAPTPSWTVVPSASRLGHLIMFINITTIITNNSLRLHQRAACVLHLHPYTNPRRQTPVPLSPLFQRP